MHNKNKTYRVTSKIAAVVVHGLGAIAIFFTIVVPAVNAGQNYINLREGVYEFIPFSAV